MQSLNYISSSETALQLHYADKSYVCSMDLVTFIEYCAHIYGTSIENNKRICQMVTRSTQNLPICFSIERNIAFLPTKSLKNTKCVLINCNRIQSLLQLTTKTCRVFFCDDTYADIECSKTTLSMQMARVQQIHSFFSRDVSPIMKLKAEHVIIS